MVGRNKELSTESVFSKEVYNSPSPVNYVIMVIDNMTDGTLDELAITEAELFIKKLFVQGDYKHDANKFQINRDDIKRILFEASVFLIQKNIFCTIGLILKPTEDGRDVFVTRTGSGASFIINSQAVNLLNEDDSSEEIFTQSIQSVQLEKPFLFYGTLKKEDTLLLCTESLVASLDLNFMQRTVILSKGPEEICKKLLHSASGTGRKDNISVAVFNGSVTRKNQNKEKISKKTLLLIIIPSFLVLLVFLIYSLTVGKEKPLVGPQTISPVPVTIPPEIKKNTILQFHVSDTQIPRSKDLVKKEDKIKKPKREMIKPPEEMAKINKNLNFIVNGSVVMVSNWESVKEDISYINWDYITTDKKKFHKYADYTSIPSSVKVIFKDNSTRSYKVK